MARHCETFDHTADIGLAAEADSLAELMAALAEGLADVICDRAQLAVAERRRITVEAEDTEALAVDFLSAVLSAIEVDRFLVAAVDVPRADANSLTAELGGEPYDPARHELKTEVKAVTYHQLEVAREGDRWTGRVILDL